MLELVRSQYAGVGAAGAATLRAAEAHLAKAADSIGEIAPLVDDAGERLAAVTRFREAYGRYCWDVKGAADLKLAPFHLLASESGVHIDKDHQWHMSMATALAKAGDGLIVATPNRVIEVADDASIASARKWWDTLVTAGGEGMVVKPLDFVTRSKGGIVQPALKCRGPEYLRIVYGPEYRLERNLVRLRERSLSSKRNLAIREFGLGIEALERFVRHEPLRAVHECVFAVLALESEPIDPRL